MEPDVGSDFDWDESPPPGEPASDLQFSTATQLAMGIGAFALDVSPPFLLLEFALFHMDGQTDALLPIAVMFVVTVALRIQLRFASPLAVDGSTIRLRFDARVRQVERNEIAWVFRSATWSGSPEVALVVGLKKRRFFGAKWLYMIGDREGHVNHFLRNSGAKLINWV